MKRGVSVLRAGSNVGRLIVCVVVLAGLLLAPVAEAVDVMQRSEVLIPKPKDDKSKRLEGMWFGKSEQERVTKFTAIRLKSSPQEGDKRPRLIWVVTMSNSRSITQLVDLKISLRDEHGKRLATGRARLSIATATVDKEYEVKMKAKAAAWESTSKIQLQAEWLN